MNRNFLLLSKIFRGEWLIDKQAAVGFLPLVAQLVEGKNVKAWFDDDDEDDEDEKPLNFYAVSYSATGQIVKYGSFDEAPQGSLSVIRIKGAIMKDDYCGSPGTSSMKAALKEADVHPNISGHILHIDSPGGTVDGTEEFAKAIKEAGKPVVAFTDGLMASAAYWIGSSSKEIIAAGQTTQIGSIGTMISMVDSRGVYEKYGYKFHDVRADDSKDKNEAYYQLLKGDYSLIKEEVLNPLNDIFLANVKANREGKLNFKENEPLTGKVYLADTAIENGLIDSIGSFELAVQRANELASATQKQSYFKQYSSMKFKATMAALLALVGFTAAASEKDLPPVSEEHLEKFNAEFTALQAAKTALETENARLTAELKTASEAAVDVTTLSAQVTSLTTERDEWKAKAEKYGAQPGALPTNPKTEKDDLEAPVSWVDPNAEHNKTLQSLKK